MEEKDTDIEKEEDMSKINELIVISGKGGTGKTTIVSAFASLAKNKIMADCDVDAADLHLIMNPEIRHRENFIGGTRAVLNQDKCIKCGKCIELCRFDAIKDDFCIEEPYCEGCSVCSYFCPVKAITMEDSISGEIFISDTRFGPFVHAKLGIAQENSGKLVTEVRKKAKKLAEENKFNLIIIDGSPGTGCPVIASLAGATSVLIVTEPTLSGIHDMKRVVELSKNFSINPSVCINKYDINIELSKKIEDYCMKNSVDFYGRLPYDENTTKAMVARKTIIEYSSGEFSNSIKGIWIKLEEKLEI
ncbi:MAG TPA: ATP-binding protein [Candidatus Eremiobacteraeota bacterium]|nr:MAG: 2-ketoisovalerate ferredoxin oxidoreductase subunit delta [bacterium ADurb.Bin363]HPZ07089.1 ATP-binding protein [Candidatus Eremiobacteraeota bacterium]